MGSETFMRKENRDKRARELRAQGHKVRKSSWRNQLVHPAYIEDFAGPEAQDTGFGNTVYKTHFSALYCVETV